MKNKLLSAVKDKQTPVTELFEVARLQKAMIFELYDESILGIDFRASVAIVIPWVGLIVFNLSAKKQKQAGFGSQKNAFE